MRRKINVDVLITWIVIVLGAVTFWTFIVFVVMNILNKIWA